MRFPHLEIRDFFVFDASRDLIYISRERNYIYTHTQDKKMLLEQYDRGLLEIKEKEHATYIVDDAHECQ